MTKTKSYAAGIWEQGMGFVEWSRHATFALARSAAIKYAKRHKSATGGALSWSGGIKGPDGVVLYLDRNGRTTGSSVSG